MTTVRSAWVTAQAARFDRWVTEHPELYEHDAYWDWARDQFIAYTLPFLPSGAVVLDVGCGDGYSAHRLAQSAHTRCVTAIDVSPQSILYAQHRYRLPKLKFVCAALEEWQAVGRFDAVYCTETIEHFEDAEDALRTIARFLPVGGVLCVRTPNRLRLENIFRRACGGSAVLVDVTHRREFSLRDLEELGARCGFRTVSWQAVTAWAEWAFVPFFLLRRVRAINVFLRSDVVRGRTRLNHRLGRLLGPLGGTLQCILRKI